MLFHNKLIFKKRSVGGWPAGFSRFTHPPETGFIL
jgi:hypothetical protein